MLNFTLLLECLNYYFDWSPVCVSHWPFKRVLVVHLEFDSWSCQILILLRSFAIETHPFPGCLRPVASHQQTHWRRPGGPAPAGCRAKRIPNSRPFACSDYTYPSVAAKRCHVPLIPQILFQESRVVVLHFVNIIVEWKTSRDKIGERRRSIVTQGKQFKQLQPERTTVIFGLFCSAVVRKPCTYHSFAEREIYIYYIYIYICVCVYFKSTSTYRCVLLLFYCTHFFVHCQRSKRRLMSVKLCFNEERTPKCTSVFRAR